MSSSSRRKRRPDKKNGHTTAPPRLTMPAVPANDASRVRLGPDPSPSPSPSPGSVDPETIFQSGTGSRYNSLKDSLRSRLLFPIEVRMVIDALARDFALQIKAASKLEWWLSCEMARATVQIDLASDQMLVNDMQVIEKAGSAWLEQCLERAQKLGARLSKSPHVVKGALERTKYGALYLIDKLQLLKDVVVSGQGIDESQRQLIFDLLGIDHAYRHNSPRVPAGTDTSALSALLAREIEQHQTSITRTLNDQDRFEQKAAMLGITKEDDKETKRLRSNQARARRRLTWAWDAFRWLRSGMAPGDIIDPETGKPLDPEAHAMPAPAAPPPDPSTPASAPTETSPAPDPTLAFLQGLPDETKQMFIMVAEAHVRDQKPPQPATPPANDSPGEPSPPSA